MTYKIKNPHLQKFRRDIERGKEGLNRGIPIRHPKLSRFIHGLQKKRIILVGGDTGTGKTAYVDDHFVVEPIDWIINNPFSKFNIDTDYWSLEIKPEEKVAKWMCAKLWKEYKDFDVLSYYDGVENRLMDSDYVLGRALDVDGNDISISPEHEAMLDSITEYMDAILEHITFITTNPTFNHIKRRLNDKANKYGEFEPKGEEILYHDFNEEVIRQAVYDHIGLFKKGGNSKKDAIDDVSAEWIFYRDICEYNIVPISQFNRGIQDVSRAKMGVEPQMSDFKDTGTTQEDADQVIALFHPFRYKQDNFKDYRVDLLEDRIRTVHLLKNRHGSADKVVGMHFIGEVGMMDELDLPNKITIADYERLKRLK